MLSHPSLIPNSIHKRTQAFTRFNQRITLTLAKAVAYKGIGPKNIIVIHINDSPSDINGVALTLAGITLR